MSIQLFKRVSYPESQKPTRTLTLAFGAGDRALFESISRVSSLEVRRLVGHGTYAELKQSAFAEGRSVNGYCLWKLRNYVEQQAPGIPPPTLGLDGDSDWSLQATFRGGAAEPLHDWYPYLEGYSPGFVQRILQRFAPFATSVLDPFAGVGTTPICAAQLGLVTYYCEVNPVLQTVIEAKTSILAMEKKDQFELQRRLINYRRTFSTLVEKSPPCIELKNSYSSTFGESKFFPDGNFNWLLRARTALDEILRCDRIAALFLELAILASLVPCSFLIRRGDVRYRTADELKNWPPRRLADLFAESVERIISDLPLSHVAHGPVLLCEDARALDRVPGKEIDAVVTSPPYLNGTNYFRNTKLELWFKRCIVDRPGLAAYRRLAVTSGINDVTVGKMGGRASTVAREVIEDLRASSYDRRIAQMVDGYFRDFGAIVPGLKRSLRKGAPVIVDIGDSNYGGVHVPTDQILKALFVEHGFEVEGDLTLRRRASRSGTPLRQALLIFRNTSGIPARVRDAPRPHWASKWNSFKRNLPHQRGEFRKRNWGHVRHSICSYQGKMKPALAHFLVSTFAVPGGTILDPFGGVGTIGLEASLSGIKSFSFDISPAAAHIARAKLSNVDQDECNEILALLERAIDKTSLSNRHAQDAVSQIRFNGPLANYFQLDTLKEVLIAREYFLRHRPNSGSAAFVLACLLHILHGNRPYALSRRSHPITPFAPSGPWEYRALMPRLRAKVARTINSALPEHFAQGQVLVQDATEWWPDAVRELDAVITSPPFFDSTRFYLANWMRLWFCGWNSADFKDRPRQYVDERQKSSFSVYAPVFRQARERLSKHGVVVLHLGKSRKCDMAAQLAAVARHWFSKYDVFSENVAHCESHGIRDKGTVTAHQFLVLS